MGERTIVIGVAGGTGSGKSTLVRKLQEAFSDAVTTLSHDYYYRAYPDLTYKERTKLNYDHPRSFETDLMIEQIRMLREGLPVERPVYSFVEHNRLPETVRVIPSKVLIVEGILIFECEELRKLMDIKVFVDTDADIRYPLSKKNFTRCTKSWPKYEIGDPSIPRNGQTDARRVRRTVQTPCRRNHPRRRLQFGSGTDANRKYQIADTE